MFTLVVQNNSTLLHFVIDVYCFDSSFEIGVVDSAKGRPFLAEILYFQIVSNLKGLLYSIIICAINVWLLSLLRPTQAPGGDAEETVESGATWQESLQELSSSARDRHSSDLKVVKSPKPHRSVRDHAGQYADGKSYLGPPLIPLDATQQNGHVAKEAKSKKPEKKTAPLAQTYAGPLDCVDDLAARQDGRRASDVCGSDSADSGSRDSAVSMDQLSTTCLGAEVTVKPRPQLEASRTYHIFPTETVVKEAGLPGAPPVRLWSPGKSSTMVVGRLSGEGAGTLRPPGREVSGGGTSHLFDPGLGSPFRTSPRLTRPRTEEGRVRSTVEFITKDFVAGARQTVNLCPDWNRGVGAISNISSGGGGASTGLKANTIQPDLPPTFQLRGVSTQPRLAAGGGAGAVTRRKRGFSKTPTGRVKKESGPGFQLETIDRKSWSASTTDTTTSSGKGTNQSSQAKGISQVGLDMAANGSISKRQGGITPPSLGPVPYFKFWNSSIPPKSREGRLRAGRRDRGMRLGLGLEGSELSLTQLAQLVLADEAGRQERGLVDAAQRVLEEQQRLELHTSQSQQLQQEEEDVAQRGSGQGGMATGVFLNIDNSHTNFGVTNAVLYIHSGLSWHCIALLCTDSRIVNL